MNIRMSIYVLVFYMCTIAMVKAVDIEFDVNDVSRPFTGFGAQVWAGDARVETLFADMNLNHMRMCPGGCNTPPTDAT